MGTVVVGAVGMWESRAFFARLFQAPCVKSAVFADFHRCVISTALHPKISDWLLRRRFGMRIVSATNQLRQPARRLGMDFRAETARFGPTSHTQMSSERWTAQDSTIGLAPD